MPGLEGQVECPEWLIFKVAGVLSDVLHVLSRCTHERDPFDLAAERIGDERDVCIGRVVWILKAREQASAEWLLRKECGGQLKLAWHNIKLKVIGQLSDIVLHLVQDVVDLRVTDLV